MRYKKGDRVYIRADLKDGERCKKTGWAGFHQYGWFEPGEFVTIEEVDVIDSFYRANGNGFLVDSFIDHIRTEQGEEKSNIIKHEDLVDGEIYKVQTKIFNSYYIFKYKKNNKYSTLHNGYISNSCFFNKNFNPFASNKNITFLIEASPEEKEHLEACIKAGKYVEPKESPKENIKIKVTPETCKLVQQWCFDRGITWGGDRKLIKYSKKPYLFIYSDDKLICYSDNIKYFENHKNKEVTLDYFGIKTSKIPWIDYTNKSTVEQAAETQEKLLKVYPRTPENSYLPETKTDDPQLFKIKKRGKVFKF